MTEPLNPTEKSLLRELLDTLSDRLSAAGCNDFSVTVTDESRAFLLAMNEADPGDDQECAEWTAKHIREVPAGSRFVTMDFMILAHLRRRLGVDS